MAHTSLPDVLPAASVPHLVTRRLFAIFIPIIVLALATAADAQTSTYVDPRFAFNVRYPETATINKHDFSPMMATALDVSFTLTLPPAMYQPKTNLHEAALFIGVGTDPAVVSACTSAIPSNGENAAGTAMIAGTQFARLTQFDGAAGSMGESTIYRAVLAGACYELVEFLYYYDISAFAPGTVQPFDEAKITGMLHAVTQSFTFVR
jgi:hypothetical protein